MSAMHGEAALFFGTRLRKPVRIARVWRNVRPAQICAYRLRDGAAAKRVP